MMSQTDAVIVGTIYLKQNGSYSHGSEGAIEGNTLMLIPRRSIEVVPVRSLESKFKKWTLKSRVQSVMLKLRTHDAQF